MSRRTAFSGAVATPLFASGDPSRPNAGNRTRGMAAWSARRSLLSRLLRVVDESIWQGWRAKRWPACSLTKNREFGSRPRRLRVVHAVLADKTKGQFVAEQNSL